MALAPQTVAARRGAPDAAILQRTSWAAVPHDTHTAGRSAAPSTHSPTAQSTAPSGPDSASGPLAIVLNAGSGHADLDERTQALDAILAPAGRAYRLFLARDPTQLATTIDAAVAFATRERGSVIAAGGDGTQARVATAVLPTGLPFGVLPQGTFNYFARARGIPTELEDGVRALLDARVAPLPLGEVNGQVFLVNASIGLYPQLIEDREAFKQRFGRNRAVALASAVASVLGEHRQGEMIVELKEERRTLRSTTLFVGANALQLERLGFDESAAVAGGALAAVIVKPVGTWAMLGLLARGALGRLDEALAVDSFAFTNLTVQPWSAARRGRVKLALDGEVTWLAPPLVFRRTTQALQLLVPRDVPRPDA